MTETIYQAIKQSVPLLDYCERNGIYLRKIGRSLRANSPFTYANNAFTINTENPEIWHDFSLTEGQSTGGDVIELSALLNHKGDKKEALLELSEFLPPSKRERLAVSINKYSQERKEEQEFIKHSHDFLFDERYTSSDKLFAHWIPYLNERGIKEEQIRRLKIGLTFKGNRLVIPRFNYDGIEVIGHKTRRMPNASGQENEAEAKYMNASNNSFVRNAPLGLQTLNRKSDFLVLCEGDFDYMNFEREGFAVLGSGGNAFTHEDWPEILSIAEKFSCVVLAFDNDKAGHEYTSFSASKLFSRNIPFRVISLPENCKDINDYYRAGGCLQSLIDEAIDGIEYQAMQFKPTEKIEDLSRGKQKEIQAKLKSFLIDARRYGVDKPDLLALCEKLKSHFPELWLQEVLKQAEKGQSEFEIVEALRKKYNFMYHESTGFFIYSEAKGIWEHKYDTFIGNLVRDYLSSLATAKKISACVEHLKRAVVCNEPLDKFNSLPLYAFKNGTLYFERESANEEFFRPSTCNDFVTVRLTYDYDVKANCPAWIETLETVFAHDKKRIACFQEFLGSCLVPICKQQKALILRNLDERGSNGKSTILAIVKKVFGEFNCTCLEPEQFADIHALMKLKHAKLNVCTDARTDLSNGESNLKKAISGETIIARDLYCSYTEFQPHAKIIFAINGNLKFSRKTGSITRRLLLIDCPNRFVDGEPAEGSNEFKKDLDMIKKLEKELPGIFNWVLEGVQRLKKQNWHFTLTAEHIAEYETFSCSVQDVCAESVSEFLDDNLPDFYDVDGNGRIFTRAEIFNKYNAWCEGAEILEISRASQKKFHSIFREALNARNIKFKECENRERKRGYDFS